MLVKSSILVHTNSTVSLSPLPACLPPLCLLSFRFRTFYRAAVLTHVRDRPRFLPPLLNCSRSARALRTFVSNAGLCHSLSIHQFSSHPFLSHSWTSTQPISLTCRLDSSRLQCATRTASVRTGACSCCSIYSHTSRHHWTRVTRSRRRLRESLEKSCRGCSHRWASACASCLLCGIPSRTPWRSCVRLWTGKCMPINCRAYACALLQVGDQDWWQRASNVLALSVPPRLQSWLRNCVRLLSLCSMSRSTLRAASWMPSCSPFSSHLSLRYWFFNKITSTTVTVVDS